MAIGSVEGGGTIYPDPCLLEARKWETKLRYFFDISDGTSMFEDDHGQTFATLKEAKAAASVFAAELATDSGQYRGFEIYVTDEDGNDVARLPIG